jgi:hypothetical protein
MAAPRNAVTRACESGGFGGGGGVAVGTGGGGLTVVAGGLKSVLTAASASMAPLPTSGSHPAGG